MIVVLPAPTPVTTPLEDPTVAMPVLLLLHVPPDVPSASAVAEPTHAVVVPVIACIGFTVTIAVMLQPPLTR